MKKKMASLILGATMMICVMVGTVACGTQENVTEQQAAAGSTEGNTVLLNAETGEELTSEEIAELAKKGAVEVSDTGKVTVVDETKVTASPAKKEEPTTAKAEKLDPSEKATEKTEKQTTAAKKEQATERVTTAPVEKKTESKADPVPEKKTEKVTEKVTEKKTEKVTEKKTEKKTEKATEKKTEKVTEKKTEAKKEQSTEKKEEPKACTHNWVWKTSTKTVHHDAVTGTYEECVEAEWTEYFYVQKYYCGACKKYYDSWDDYDKKDKCYGGWSLKDVLDHTVDHPAKYQTVTYEKEPAWDETVEVKDYQYCSKCGKRK